MPPCNPGILSGLPVAVPDLSGAVGNPVSLLSSLPVADLQSLLTTLPDSIPPTLP